MAYIKDNMSKICLNSRDEVIIIDLSKVAFFQAKGCYALVNFIEGETTLLTTSLGKLEELVTTAYSCSGKLSQFIRLGRSLIINQDFLSSLNIIKRKITLSDRSGHSFILELSKPTIKKYKEMLIGNYLNGSVDG